MKIIIKLADESRKDYLVRVVIAMLKENAEAIEPIIYDDATCDALCLAGDLEDEFEPIVKK